MQFPDDNQNSDCARLNKYLDGEMLPAQRNAFEIHIEECEGCRIEVDVHNGIEIIPDDIVLPKDFSKVVAATAESQVGGLRQRKERKVTLVIIATLGVILFTLLGANLNAVIRMLKFGIEQTGTILSVVGTFLLNLAFGVVVIVKVAAAETDLSSGAVAAIVGFIFVILLAYLFLTGRIAGLRDAKR